MADTIKTDTSNGGNGRILIAAIVVIILVAVAALFINSLNNNTTSTTVTTIATTQQPQPNTTSVAPSTTVNQTKASYINTIYYAGYEFTIYPGATSGVQFNVPGNTSANLTGAFYMKTGSVYVAVLNATEYTHFEAYPGDITSSKYYLGHTNSENISVIIPPGTYTLAFFNPNASSNAQYNVLITRSITLYTT